MHHSTNQYALRFEIQSFLWPVLYYAGPLFRASCGVIYVGPLFRILGCSVWLCVWAIVELCFYACTFFACIGFREVMHGVVSLD